jgi:glutathione-specific gamma-glutamylcyclotransferase
MPDTSTFPHPHCAVPTDCPHLAGGDLWVFGYGSLMWNPGFEYVRAAPALLRGYHRSFCVYSHGYRGTPEAPGLVLGLDRGGSCRGMAFLVAAQCVAEVVANLWAREMNRRVYRPRLVPVEVRAQRVAALTFLADPRHQAYAGRLPAEVVARHIAHSQGARGTNVDYLANTLAHLDGLGIRERRLHALLLAVKALQRATR